MAGRSIGGGAPGEGVIVLGVDSQIGLAIVRELGRMGVLVCGIARSRRAVGLYSRYLRAGYIHEGRDGALVDRLHAIAAEHGARYVMTVSEGDIFFLNRHRNALAPLIPLVPGAEAMEAVVDKAHVYAVAQGLGIPTPRNHTVTADGSVQAPEDLDYPVILKWSKPLEVLPTLRAHGLPLRKAEYCHSPQELDAALERYKCAGAYPLVQSYCPGHGLGHMVYMHEGEPVLRFQHRRLHEWPPEGGYSTLCESLPRDAHPELMAQSVGLLRAIGWEGPAMVEYRYDAVTRSAVLMEINGRFWGSLPLAYHAGAWFAWALYMHMGLGETRAAQIDYKTGLRCKFMLPDAKRLFRIMFRQSAIPDRTLRFNRGTEVRDFITYMLDPRSRYYVFTWRDPAPLLREFGHALLGFVTRR